jgi:hypothetical protein
MAKKLCCKIYYDSDSGELTDIDFSDTFRNTASALMQVDVIGDILERLIPEHEAKIEEWQRELHADIQQEPA